MVKIKVAKISLHHFTKALHLFTNSFKSRLNGL
nr:MAG TPA: hypothetical protein [Caudoviricetes sp.]